jgi:NADPH2:quinone reductase
MSDYRIIFRTPGGPEVLERETISAPTPAPGEAVVRHEAVGLNFIDTYHRSGLYPVPLPSGLGGEGAGVVEAIGEGVTDVAVGDRVVYAGTVLGAYATVRAINAEQLVKLPDAIDDKTAAAAFLKGLTADMLVGACGKVQPGQAILVHAAAGGMGSLLVQWVHAIGATVIAHAGSPEKAEKARALGADHVLSCPFDALAGEVRRLTGGRGVDTVFDGVGKDSWAASLASIARRGLMVTYGNASGAVPPVPPLDLMRAGSLFLTRPTMGDYSDSPADRRAAAQRLFDMILSGKLQVEIGQTFALADAAQAHRALEGRTTTGSTVLLPTRSG